MNLPRWLVIGMLTSSVLAVLAAVGWWWVTWPEQDMHEFLNLVENDRFEEANEIMVNSGSWVRLPGGTILFHVNSARRVSCGSAAWRDEFRNAERQPRTWADLCAGRVRIRLLPEGPMNMGGPFCVELVLEKHRVSSVEVDISYQELQKWWPWIEAQSP